MRILAIDFNSLFARNWHASGGAERTDESIALWETLMEPGQAATEFDLLCETAEWQEMIAQGVG